MAEELIRVFSKPDAERQDSTPHEKLTINHFDGDQKFQCPHNADVAFYITKPADVEIWCVQESLATPNNQPELWRVTAASNTGNAIRGTLPLRGGEKYALRSSGGSSGTKNVFVRILKDTRGA